MAVAPKIADFGIVNIDTTPIHITTNPGFAGVAIITKGQKQSLNTYYSLSDVAGDFNQNSYAYNAASNYFDNPNATTFQVITYDPNSNTGSTADNSKLNSALSALESNLNSLKSNPSSFNSAKTNSSTSDLFNTGDSKINSALTTLSHDLSAHNVIDNDVSSLKSIVNSYISSNPSNSSDPAVAALTKYYNCGAEFFVFEVANDDDKKTAVDLSNLVEGQSQNVLFLDQPTDGIATASDFSWYDNSIKDNESTELFSLPYSGDPASYQFVSAVLSQYAGQSPASNLELTNNLPNIKPQDYYSFTPSDFNVYKNAGVATYCYRNDTPMLSTGNSADGYQVSNLITRDYLNDQIKNEITTMLINHHNAGHDIHFDQTGVNEIIAAMTLVLSAANKAGYIQNPHVRQIDVNKIPEAVKEEGQLNGLSYNWQPNNNINHIEFHQEIVLPQLTNA